MSDSTDIRADLIAALDDAAYALRLGVDDPTRFWQRLLGGVSSYADLDPTLVGAVERLIDFVTTPAE